MKIEQIQTHLLKPYKKNSKAHPIEQIQKLAKIIKKVGFNVPIVIDENVEILAGHGRLQAAQELGLEEVPCVRVVGLSDDDKVAWRIADNKITESDWNDYLVDEIKLLNGNGYDLELTGFSEEELAALDDSIVDVSEVEEDDFDTEQALSEPKYPVLRGQVYELGDHRLMCGDSTSEDDVKELMNGEVADMCFTDPPYLMGYSGGMQTNDEGRWTQSFNSKHDAIKNDKMSKEDGVKFLDSINNIIKENVEGAFYITFYRLGIGNYYASLDRVGLQTRVLIIWNKGNHTLSNSDYWSKYEPIFYGWVNKHEFQTKNEFDIWDIPRTQKNDLHPTMKPIELCARAINNSSKESESVLDLFGGSGSTLIACEQTNRSCYMMELDTNYCSVIIERWEKLTGQKHKKIE